MARRVAHVLLLLLMLPLSQLFQLIGLRTSGATGVSKETVTLAHFLDVADAVVRPSAPGPLC